MNRRKFMASVGFGILGLTSVNFLKKNNTNNTTEWKNTRKLSEAFSTIEDYDKNPDSVEMHPHLYFKAKDNENKGTMELPYLMDFDKKSLWNAPVVLNSNMAKNKIYVCGNGERIPVVINC
jgi:hypothetical protein